MDKKRKDSVIRATVDRAALLRGVLMLTALALLLCFGLKPSRAAAPDAEVRTFMKAMQIVWIGN